MRPRAMGAHAGPPLRLLAIAIVVAGVVDPGITIRDRVRPEVAVTADDRLPDPGLVDRVAEALRPRFTIVRGPTIGAAAAVHVGFRLPDAATRQAPRAFVIAPQPRAPWVAIEAIAAPRRADLHSRVPIAVRVRSLAAGGRAVELRLESAGVAVDRTTRDIASDDDRHEVTLTFAGAAMAGTAPLVVRARIAGDESEASGSAARADLGIDIRDRRWAVLVFDRRPSWVSTFVRRALEADPRFVVTSRIGTSRGASVAAGRAPATLTELPSLALFDAVVLGAPEELTEADVAGLEAFMRQRGGAVVLLPDEPGGRRPYQRLLGPAPWRLVERPDATGEPRASVFYSPDPDRFEPLWGRPVGAGRLVVAAAIDSWRFRDADSGAFDRFWTLVIAEAADATPPPIDVVPDRLVLAPGETTTARVYRGPATDAEVFRLRPSADAGPERVEITRNGARAEATVIVVPDARHPAPDETALLEAWVQSRSGQLLPERRVAELVPALERALSPPSQSVQWFPMRSPWWIVPFAIALGAEWWIRRRSGLT